MQKNNSSYSGKLLNTIAQKGLDLTSKFKQEAVDIEKSILNNMNLVVMKEYPNILHAKTVELLIDKTYFDTEITKDENKTILKVNRKRIF